MKTSLKNRNGHPERRRIFPPLVSGMIALLFFPGAAGALFSAEKFSLTVGGEQGWSMLEETGALQETEGRFSLPALAIAPRGETSGQGNGELYLPFDTPDIRDAAGKYDVLYAHVRLSAPEQARQGTGAALCNTTGEGILLRGNGGALFSAQEELPSFTVSFWLYPSSTETGGQIFSWRSSVIPEEGEGLPVYQSIRAGFERNRLVWEFSNLWITQDGRALGARLEPVSLTVPGRWSFYQISYDAYAGVLEYRINGRTEAIVNPAAGGGSAIGFVGNPSNVEIVPQYAGLLDEFRIARQALPAVRLEDLQAVSGRYPAAGGTFRTKPLDTGKGTARLLSADISLLAPEGTDSEFFVRGGDNFHTWTADSPQWVPLVNGKPAAEITGRYMQISGGLYPDSAREKTPLLTWISLHLEKENSPWPPLNVRGTAGNGKVKISWNAPADRAVNGYLVYYGEAAGEYLSAGSPADAGNSLSCVISGLENGKMYYFSVASYGEAGPDFPGNGSPEISLRPLAAKSWEGD